MLNRNVAGNTFQDIYRSLKRHKQKSVWFFVAVVTGTLLFTLFTPSEYRSEGKLFLRLGRENSTLDPTATLGQTPTVTLPSSRENEINSVVEILQSRVLFEKVVDSLGPDAIMKGQLTAPSDKVETSQPENKDVQQASAGMGQYLTEGKNFLAQFSSSAGIDDRERAIIRLMKKVKVEAGKKSNVIDITCDGSSPAQCQAIVAKLIDVYLDEHVRLNRTQGSHEFLTTQTNRLRTELTRKETELSELKSKTGLASPNTQRQLLVARIGRLEDELLSTEASRVSAQARVNSLREKMTSLPETQVTTETSGHANEGTDRMREQFYALQVREKEAASKYAEDHPKMRQIREQVATAREVLSREERERKQVTKEPGRLHHQTELSLLTEEPSLLSLEARAKRLLAQLDGVRKELITLNENELRITAFQREVDLLDADYRKCSNNLEQARIDQQLEAQRMSNVSIVQPASFEPKPVRPRKMVNLLLGICAGLFGGLALPLGLDQLKPQRIVDRPKEQTMPPKLASIPCLSPQETAARRRRVPR